MKFKSGDQVTLVLSKGSREKRKSTISDEELADYSEREVTGTVRSFYQDGQTCWEISTGDPQYPAIGFDPENVTVK